MTGRPSTPEREGEEQQRSSLPDLIDRKARRKARARRNSNRSVWFGIGMFGMVGWTVAITTLLGLVLGRAMDRAWPGGVSWTLTMFFVGLILGCMNAWYWITRESRLDPEDDFQEDDDE